MSLRALSHLGRRLHSTSYIMCPVIWPPLEGGEARRRFGDQTRWGVRGGGGGGGGGGAEAGEATRSWRGSDLLVPAGVPRPLLSPSASDQSRGSGDERDRVQKKTFTKWANKHLMKVRKHINDLYEDLRDGHNLISLLEVLSGIKLPREKGRMRFHRLQNVQIALDFLKQRQVKLVNIRNDDITDGNPKLTLGLIWTIILHFQISDIYISGESGDMSAKEKLLLWTQKVTAGYTGIKCTNFSSCWSDGKMFNALIHRYR
uniref:Microtubule actin crosslinking factor 1 n=1 Tax=Bos mutus grunniens TaxID=30521 RepID=A0A8B9WPH3_BOSMU